MSRVAVFSCIVAAALASPWSIDQAHAVELDVVNGTLSPGNRISVIVEGSAPAVWVRNNTTVDLPDGSYTVRLYGDQGDYGTFDVVNDQVANLTGALYYRSGPTRAGSTATGSIDFDLSLLAAVGVPAGDTAEPRNRGSMSFAGAAGTYFSDSVAYLPETRLDRPLRVTDRSGRVHFGSFYVDANLQPQVLAGEGAEAVYVAPGTTDLELDRSKLVEVTLDFSDLTSPTAKMTAAIPETGGGIGGSPVTLFLSPDSGAFAVTDRFAYATYGVFTTGPNGELDIVTDAATKATCPAYYACDESADVLDVTPEASSHGALTAYRLTPDKSQLSPVLFQVSDLSDPVDLVRGGITELYWGFGDVTFWLAPNRTGRPYRFLLGTKQVGTFGVDSAGSITTDGAVVAVAGGVSVDPCAVNQFTVDYEDPILQTYIASQTNYLPSGATITIADGTFSWYARVAASGATYTTVIDGTNGDTLPVLDGLTITRQSCNPDSDGDTVVDEFDNCPTVPNIDQVDQDLDGLGDLCDDDLDGDGIDNVADNCPDFANADQADLDGDALGDVCDGDDDGDSVADDGDNCLGLANTDQADSDADGFGDACDPDDDNDGVADAVDNCVFAANSDQADADADGQGDVCDGDDDNDGVADTSDLCPGTPADAPIDATGCDGAGYVAYSCGDAAGYVRHGDYVSCVAHAANAAVDAGLISPKEKARFVRAAAKSK